MKNSEQPAFARPISHDERPGGNVQGDRAEYFNDQKGLTKREYFAGLALQGLLSHQDHCEQSTVFTMISLSIDMADELLVQLEA